MKNKTILFIDACPRKESRTRELAKELLNSLNGDIFTVNLSETVLPEMTDENVKARTDFCRKNDYSDSMFGFAKQFASADIIVISAPFWDLSFPACLKKYIEAITVSGLTFRYSNDGIPQGLCKAKDLYYVSTSGGPIFNDAFGFGYIEALAKGMYGIENCHKIYAENLDVIGNDPHKILENAKIKIKEIDFS